MSRKKVIRIFLGLLICISFISFSCKKHEISPVLDSFVGKAALSTNFYEVHYTGKYFFVGGSLGGSWYDTKFPKTVLLKSSDGINFEHIVIDYKIPIRAIASNNKIIIAAGDMLHEDSNITETYHYSLMLISTDNGKTWEEAPGIYDKPVVKNPAFRNTSMIEDILYNNGYFYATTDDGDLYKSKKGVRWEQVETDYISELFMAQGKNNLILYGSNYMALLDNKGIIKEINDLSFMNYFTGSFYLNDQYIGYGYFDCCFGEIPAKIQYYSFSSEDGLKWKYQDLQIDSYQNFPQHLKYFKDQYIGLSSDFSLLYGTDWNNLKVGEFDKESITGFDTSKKMCLLVGEKGLLKYSADAHKWNDAKIKLIKEIK